MLALLEAARNPSYPARPCLVLSNNPEAAGLARAAVRGVPVAAVDHRPFAKDRAAFEQALDAVLLAHGTEFIALAGFMRVLTGGFVGRWQGRMVNIHPSLLPLYRGLDTHARALAAGDTEHGCTVHWVVPELDAGEIIEQVRVPILPGDDAAMLAARVLAAEHALYPVALASAIRQAG
jgi:phosphoribosylglycinamide formyltransferase-1